MAGDRENWYVLTGGPSTGKTSVLNELEKIGYHTMHEAARSVIEAGLAEGISLKAMRQDIVQFQRSIANLNLVRQNALDPQDTIFFDRAMLDGLAYLIEAGAEIPADITEIVDGQRYGKVFLFEPLEQYFTDYYRLEHEDIDFTRRLNGILEEVYSSIGVNPIRVPAMPVEERVKFILDHVA